MARPVSGKSRLASSNGKSVVRSAESQRFKGLSRIADRDRRDEAVKRVISNAK